MKMDVYPSVTVLHNILAMFAMSKRLCRACEHVLAVGPQNEDRTKMYVDTSVMYSQIYFYIRLKEIIKM
jgi:hypothetical protein